MVEFSAKNVNAITSADKLLASELLYLCTCTTASQQEGEAERDADTKGRIPLAMKTECYVCS